MGEYSTSGDAPFEGSAAPTKPSGDGAGSCARPIYSTSNPDGAVDIDGGAEHWWVNNDAWSGSHGPQTIYVCNQSSWYAVSNQPNGQGAVETYPDTEYDVGGRNNGLPTKPIAQYSSITSTFSEAFPSAGSWDAAYDLWLNNWGTEIMIWNEWTGASSTSRVRARRSLSTGCRTTSTTTVASSMFFRDSVVKLRLGGHPGRLQVAGVTRLGEIDRCAHAAGVRRRDLLDQWLGGLSAHRADFQRRIRPSMYSPPAGAAEIDSALLDAAWR